MAWQRMGLRARLGPRGSLVLEGMVEWLAVTDRQGLEGGVFESKSRARGRDC